MWWVWLVSVLSVDVIAQKHVPSRSVIPPHCLPMCCLQVRYHPDKVPTSAPLAERVMAEEVSKVLNAHNWCKR